MMYGMYDMDGWMDGCSTPVIHDYDLKLFGGQAIVPHGDMHTYTHSHPQAGGGAGSGQQVGKSSN